MCTRTPGPEPVAGASKATTRSTSTGTTDGGKAGSGGPPHAGPGRAGPPHANPGQVGPPRAAHLRVIRRGLDPHGRTHARTGASRTATTETSAAGPKQRRGPRGGSASRAWPGQRKPGRGGGGRTETAASAWPGRRRGPGQGRVAGTACGPVSRQPRQRLRFRVGGRTRFRPGRRSRPRPAWHAESTGARAGSRCGGCRRARAWS